MSAPRDYGIAADALKSYIDRIIRLLEERDAIMSDVREVYAEGKGNGFDKTVMGQVVSTLRKRAKDSADFDEKQAIYDLYMQAYDGTERATRPHTHEASSAHELKPRRSSPVPEGEGSGKHAVAEVPGAAAGDDVPAQIGGEATETTVTGDRDAVAPAPAPVPSATRSNVVAPSQPFDIGDIPAFLDRRTKPKGASLN